MRIKVATWGSALVAAMMMAQAQLICDSGERPILLLDDLASEFDDIHVKKVLKAGLNLGVQIWITGTDLLPFMHPGDSSFRVFHVKHGAVSVLET